jgi:PTH2 family peptidyl-tRNA hydrolase
MLFMKLAIVVRKDLGMSCGKIAGQVGHASVMAYRMASGTHESDQWYNEGQKKIVLKTENGESLAIIASNAERQSLSVQYIRDFGLTQIEPNTLTCIAIGPDSDEKIDSIVGGLKLL